MNLKKIIPASLPLVAFLFAACGDSGKSTWEEYADWRTYNQNWLTEMSQMKNPDGTPYYRNVVASWDPEAFVLMHLYPSDTVNTDNLKPLYTSTTKVNYTVRLANDSLIDQGTGYVSTLNSTGLIDGWALAVMELHVGDSAEFIMPYNVAYGESGYGKILPYTNLRYGIRLVDIPYYEIRP
ncbi:MAG: FKBP-type peptidyl-prolyl cis-trans isomerase [Bacteroidales bacterium]|nr:FKBP-type peptidyl-prolyl cis-trans isomerase [Bacteroidales bacterium]